MYSCHTIITGYADVIRVAAFNANSTRLATCNNQGVLKVWDHNADLNVWVDSSTLRDPCGVIHTISWGHPQVSDLLATSSYDRRVLIWQEIVTENVIDISFKSSWAKRAQLTHSRAPITDVKFSPLELGVLLATCAEDGKIRMYSADDAIDFSTWTLIQEIKCDIQCSKLVWHSSFSKIRESPKTAMIKIDTMKIIESDFTNDDQKEDSCEDKELKDGYPFKYRQSDKFIVKPHTAMMGVISNVYDDVSNPIAILQYLPHSSRWMLFDFDFNIKEPVYDMAFAPRLGNPFDLIAVGTSKLLLYSIYHIADRTGHLRQELSLIGIYTEHKCDIYRVCWSSSGSCLTTAGADKKIRLWRTDVNEKYRTVSIIAGEQISSNSKGPLLSHKSGDAVLYTVGEDGRTMKKVKLAGVSYPQEISF